MEVITGTCRTYKGASRTSLSLDFGSFALNCDNAVVDEFNQRRVAGDGRLVVADPTVPSGERFEVPCRLAWALDSQDKATEIIGAAVSPDGAAIQFGSGMEGNTSMIEKMIEGMLIIA